MTTYYSQHRPGFVLILIASLFCMALMFSGCDSTETPSEDELFLQKLKGDWTLTGGKVLLDDLDISDAFIGMSITFAKDKTYSSVHAAPIWPEEGTFSISKNADGSYTLLRDGDTPVLVSGLTESQVTFTFHYTATNGRINSISGQYKFIMSR